ncbi:MAG: GIY-YIG nuclease family protein [Gammaproteobacteria bacterium]|nr:GIY-YIG nuclease family protein [Gammaproteobacteria bacterium]
MNSIKPGYIYVLEHPSDPDLYKIGITTREPKKRLAEHNSDFTKAAGLEVKETGQTWVLKEYHAVPDPYLAESAFWAATPFSLFPFRSRVEIKTMSWETVQAGLSAARKVGVRPKSKPQPDHVYAYNAWMKKRLIGRGIVLVSHVRSKYGKSNFRCSQGHEWRTVPNEVAEGKGCPHCGQGARTPEEIRENLDVGVLCLLVSPLKLGFIRVVTVRGELEHLDDSDDIWNEWEIQRYRSVEEPELAETLIFGLLGNPTTDDDGLIEMDIDRAERAFKELHYSMVRQIAMAEKRHSETMEGDPS